MRKRSIIKIITWIALVVASVVFAYHFNSFKIFTRKWVLMLIVILSLLISIFGILSLTKRKTWVNVLTTLLNLILTAALVTGSIALPYVRTRIEKAFTPISSSETIEINFYTVSDKYKSEHPEIFSEATSSNSDTTAITATVVDDKEIRERITNLMNVQNNLDLVNQKYALDFLKDMTGEENLNTQRFDTIYDAYDALLSGNGELLVMSKSYVDVITSITGYEDFKENTRVVFTVTKESDLHIYENKQIARTPFNVLLIGSDDINGFDEINTERSKTDAIIVVTVNPNTKQIILSSLTRDLYVDNPALGNVKDRLSHLALSGVSNTVKGVSQLLDQDIEIYAETVFGSFAKIIDAIGGVDIYNDYGFYSTYWDYYYAEGNIHLNGDQALEFCRTRIHLTDGSYGRARNVSKILKAMINKVLTEDSLSNSTKLLESISGLVKTNVSTDTVFALVQMQLEDMADWEIITYTLTGTTAIDYWSTYQQYGYVSYVNEYERSIIIEEIDKVMEGEIVTQRSLN